MEIRNIEILSVGKTEKKYELENVLDGKLETCPVRLFTEGGK